MKISKKDGNVNISQLKTHELFNFLKMQVISKIIFLDETNNNIDNKLDISLLNRDFINNDYCVEIEILGKSEIVSYTELLKIIGDNLTLTKCFVVVSISVNEFKEKEPLIVLLSSINKDITASCVFIDYNNNVFEIVNKPFKNGDSDKMYYFELNDTLLAFSVDGPILLTDNNSINSIEDVIC